MWGMDSSGSEKLIGCCERGNERPNSIKSSKCLGDFPSEDFAL